MPSYSVEGLPNISVVAKTPSHQEREAVLRSPVIYASHKRWVRDEQEWPLPLRILTVLFVQVFEHLFVGPSMRVGLL